MVYLLLSGVFVVGLSRMVEADELIERPQVFDRYVLRGGYCNFVTLFMLFGAKIFLCLYWAQKPIGGKKRIKHHD
jgi:hypothetical protein